MPHVLAVAAFELRHPVAFSIALERRHSALHAGSLAPPVHLYRRAIYRSYGSSGVNSWS